MIHSTFAVTYETLFAIILIAALIPTIIVLGLWIADSERDAREPTGEETDAACRNIYSNFDDLSPQVKDLSRNSARAWIKAWMNALSEEEP